MIPAWIISVILSICLHRKNVEIILVIPQIPMDATTEAMVMGLIEDADAAPAVMLLTIFLRTKGETIAKDLPKNRQVIDFQKRPIESLWKMNG